MLNKISELHSKGVSPAGIVLLLLQLGVKTRKMNYYGLLKIVKSHITSLKSGKAAERGE